MNRTFKLVELSLYYVVICLILREWLVPIMLLTGTGYMEMIFLFIVLCLVISLLRIHFLISWIIKIVYIAWFIVHVYSEFSILSIEGFDFLISEMGYNLAALFQGNWLSVTNAFRSILFFILIWMLVYLIHHWLTVRLNVFFFLLLTIIFITTLDTFTDYDGSRGIVVVLFLGLIMAVFLYTKKLYIETGIYFKQTDYVKLAFPVILLIGLAGTIAILLPKAAPQWPDPVPYIKSATGQYDLFGKNVSKVGYDEDDTQLGGAFIGDDTVVFIAHATSKQYWRVETKDVYTSKGWESSIIGDIEYYDVGEYIHHSLPVGDYNQRVFAHIETKYPYDFVIQPYGLISIYHDTDLNLVMDRQTEKISTIQNGENGILNKYMIEYSTPEYLYSDLISSIEQPVDARIRKRYLQLPDTLPQRVMDLAQDIVEGKTSDYDKARAIESYFSTNGFRYETKGVPVPKENQDYVDQFLFESKIGYCDNFSTAMVVMLRSVGIPARWVKGFAGGEVVGTDGKLKTFEITNNDAHSWVEAYLPKVGWVPFEPTIGFTTNRFVHYDLETDAYQEDVLTAEEETEPEDTMELEDTSEKSTDQGLVKEWLNKVFGQVYFYIGLFMLLVIVSVGAFLLRKKWLPKVYLKWYKKRPFNEETIETYFMKLLKVLELNGLKRKEGQTLHSFAMEVDEKLSCKQMSILTNAYENYLYGNNRTELDFVKMKECWEYLINRSSS